MYCPVVETSSSDTSSCDAAAPGTGRRKRLSTQPNTVVTTAMPSPSVSIDVTASGKLERINRKPSRKSWTKPDISLQHLMERRPVDLEELWYFRTNPSDSNLHDNVSLSCQPE